MPYYVWKRKGKIVAYDFSPTKRPAPAIEISDDEAKELGVYMPPPAPATEPVEPTPTEQEDMASMLIDHEYRLTLMELGLSEGGEA